MPPIEALIDLLEGRHALSEPTPGIQSALLDLVPQATDEQIARLLRSRAVSLVRLRDAVTGEAMARILLARAPRHGKEFFAG